SLFFQEEFGIRFFHVTGVQTCALPISNAAYRHFKYHQALFEAVRAVALSLLARAMEAELDGAQALRDTRQRARATFRGVGLGYLHFAREEPGLFRTAFAA